jgi:glutamyl-tRNA synthetase
LGSAATAVGRLAPSPTGALHLGNARSFLLAWLSARQAGGQVILRIEDIDSPRVKPWAVAATIEDLKWLGLDWDHGPESGDHGPKSVFGAGNSSISCVQTHRLQRYRDVLDVLLAAGKIYPCTCTRSEVAGMASAPHESMFQPLEGPVYPGTCRNSLKALPPDAEFAYRWAFDDQRLEWTDVVHGRQSANPLRQLGDFVIARGNGIPAYQLAVVVDDFDMGVTEVVRGDDLVNSTFRQLAILKHLGWPIPTYVHVPLLVGTDGKRLAKRHGDTRLSFFREAGVTPQAIVGYLAWTLKLIEKCEPIRAAALVGQLDWSKLPRTSTMFDLATELPGLQAM